MAEHNSSGTPVSEEYKDIWDGLTALCDLSTRIAKEKGWDITDKEQLLLIHSEISEAAEELRKKRAHNEVYFMLHHEDGGATLSTTCKEGDPGAKPEGFPVELADAIIRIANLCGKYNIDLSRAVVLKTEYNKTRPHRHGGKAF